MNQRVQRCDVNMNPVQSGPAQMGGRTDGQLKMRKNVSTHHLFFTHDLQQMFPPPNENPLLASEPPSSPDKTKFPVMSNGRSTLFPLFELAGVQSGPVL